MKPLYAFPHYEKLLAFILERHQIFLRRQKGAPPPWTDDKILREYKFCNVYRELDRVTIWIRTHWREPHKDHPALWFAMVVARLVNHPDTLAQLSLPGRWNKKQFIDTLLARKQNKEQVFSGAYIISTGGKAMDKAVYLANDVLDPLWNNRSKYEPRPGGEPSLKAYHERLMDAIGMGSFMAAQVVADLKYTPPFMDAKDWWTFAASGPGSRRGMNYVMGHDPRSPWREHEWREALSELQYLVTESLKNRKHMPQMHAQDLQNCLCEFSKYRRTQLGTGRPKSFFTPNPQPLV